MGSTVNEKRRYFRINEHIGLRYERLDAHDGDESGRTTADLEVLIGAQTGRIDQLLADVSVEMPKVAELVNALNHKLDLMLNQLVAAPRATDTAASLRDVNISACGLGFRSDQGAASGSHWRLVLELSPRGRKVQCKGVLIACEKLEGGFYWRIDFYGMTPASQELLVQHIVQHQSAQLKDLRGL